MITARRSLSVTRRRIALWDGEAKKPVVAPIATTRLKGLSAETMKRPGACREQTVGKAVIET